MNPDLILNAGPDGPFLDRIDRLGNMEFIDDQQFADDDAFKRGYFTPHYRGVLFFPH